jgi:UrcA family protein
MTKFLSALAAIATAVPAFAEPLPVETVTVAIADLDLASAAGQQTLDARIHRAVVEVCGQASVVDLAGLNAVRDCRRTKLAEARAIGDHRLASRSTSAIQLSGR